MHPKFGRKDERDFGFGQVPCVLLTAHRAGYQYRGTRYESPDDWPSKFAATLGPQFTSTPLPAWSVHLFALGLPWAEAIVGLAVLFGVATRWALVVGALEIAALTFGTTLRQDWESAGLQLSYALVYALLLAAREYNFYSIDRWLQTSAARDQG